MEPAIHCCPVSRKRGRILPLQSPAVNVLIQKLCVFQFSNTLVLRFKKVPNLSQEKVNIFITYFLQAR